jgi:hypothetical protein
MSEMLVMKSIEPFSRFDLPETPIEPFLKDYLLSHDYVRWQTE